MELGPDAVPRVRGATDVTCGPNSITFTVRTQKPMTGLMYAQQYYDDEKCVKVNYAVSTFIVFCRHPGESFRR